MTKDTSPEKKGNTMRTMTIRKSIAVGAVASLAMFTAACGTDEEEPAADTAADDTSEEETTDEPTEEEPTEEETEEAPEEEMDPAITATLAGPGCEGYAEENAEGPASVQGMAQESVSGAASGNPLLTTLVATVTGEFNPEVNLAGTLDSQEAITVFAPVDDAFAALPPKTAAQLQKPANAQTLETILTYHVLGERVEPQELSGAYATLAGPELEVSGQPDNLMINGESAVICGGVQTQNATVYLIDTVLSPPEGGR